MRRSWRRHGSLPSDFNATDPAESRPIISSIPSEEQQETALIKVDARKGRLAGLLRGDHRLILRDTFIVALFILLAKLAAAAKEMVVAWRFGTGPIVDAYLLAFNLISLPVAVWYSVIFAVLIPLVARLRESRPDEELRFRRELFGATIILGLGVGFLVWVCLRSLLALSDLGLVDETRSLAAGAVDWLVFLVPLGFLVHLCSVFLMSRGWHANSLFEGAPALTLLALLLLWNVAGIEVLLLGSLGGFVLQLALTWGLLRGGKMSARPSWRFASPEWASFRSGVGLLIAAQLMLALTSVLDQFFAARLGSGSISTLGYSTRVLTLFLALGATALGRATLPVYSRVAAKQPARLPRLATQWTILLGAIGAAVTVLGWISAEWMVRLLFERGAFTFSDSARVAEVLRWGFLQVPFYFAMIAASQALFSAGRYGTAVVLAAVSLATKFVLNVLLVPRLGLGGLMISTAGMYALSCAVLLYLLGRIAQEARS